MAIQQKGQLAVPLDNKHMNVKILWIVMWNHWVPSLVKIARLVWNRTSVDEAGKMADEPHVTWRPRRIR